MVADGQISTLKLTGEQGGTGEPGWLWPSALMSPGSPHSPVEEVADYASNQERVMPALETGPQQGQSVHSVIQKSPECP